MGRSNNEHIGRVLGRHFIGNANERGERLVQFCFEHDLKITNTFFTQPPRRLYTWISPGNRYRNQIDYILIRQRWSSSITDARTRPGADCGSDHQLLTATFKIKLKTCSKKKTQILPRIRQSPPFQESLSKHHQIDVEDTPNKIWQNIKKSIEKAIEETQIAGDNRAVQRWMTEDTLALVLERRRCKASGLNDPEALRRYRDLDRRVQRGCCRDKNEFYTRLCTDLQRHADRCECRDLFLTIKKITKKFKPSSWSIRNKDGEMTDA